MVRAVVFEGTGRFAPLAEPRQPTLGLADLRTDVPGVGRGIGQPRASRGNGVAVREVPVCFRRDRPFCPFKAGPGSEHG